jgi:glucose-1-phosphate thymidylyltransferase
MNISRVGLIPAAGIGSRLGRLPFSKELLPVRIGETDSAAGAVECAIDNAVKVLVENDISRQFVILRPGKWDIPAYLVSGSHLHADIGYLLADASPSVPKSLDAAYAFVRTSEVVLVFPDIVFRPVNAIEETVALRAARKADVALALVPSTRGDKVDIVSVSDTADVVDIRAKPGKGESGWTWVAAAWDATFTEFLHDFLGNGPRGHADPAQGELYVADVLNAAIRAGLSVCAARFADGEAIDVGTVADLTEAWSRPR